MIIVMGTRRGDFTEWVKDFELGIYRLGYKGPRYNNGVSVVDVLKRVIAVGGGANGDPE